jgi:hypothetical protein
MCMEGLRYIIKSFSAETSLWSKFDCDWKILQEIQKILHCCWRFSEPNTVVINTFFGGKTSPLHVTNTIKMKRFRSLNTTNGLLAKMESSYVTTCFGLHLWPSSGYNLEDKRNTYCIISPSEVSHTLRNNCPAPFFYPPEQTRAALYTQYFILCTLDLLG